MAASWSPTEKWAETMETQEGPLTTGIAVEGESVAEGNAPI